MIMLTAPDSGDREGARRERPRRIDEIGAFEVNEAFAPVPLAWLAEYRGRREGLNPSTAARSRSAIPLGGSGARLMTTLVHHMQDNGIRYGLQTMCEGGGQANATILELLCARPGSAGRS